MCQSSRQFVELLHLSCHSAKCHMSFSFAFPLQCIFSPSTTHCYPPSPILDFSEVCIVLLLFFVIFDHSHSMYLSLFSLVFISAFLTPYSTSLSFNVSTVVLGRRTISTPLAISDSGMCQASDFCDVNRPPFSGYTGRHHSYI